MQNGSRAKVRHGANPDAGIYACCQHYCGYYTIISFGASNALRTGQVDNFYLGDSIYFSFGFFRHIIYGIYMKLFATKRSATFGEKFTMTTCECKPRARNSDLPNALANARFQH